MTNELIIKLKRLLIDLYAEKISYDDLFNQIPELSSESELSHLLGLIEHQPSKRQFFGGDNTFYYEEHKQALFDVLDKLEKKYEDNEVSHH